MILKESSTMAKKDRVETGGGAHKERRKAKKETKKVAKQKAAAAASAGPSSRPPPSGRSGEAAQEALQWADHHMGRGVAHFVNGVYGATDGVTRVVGWTIGDANLSAKSGARSILPLHLRVSVRIHRVTFYHPSLDPNLSMRKPKDDGRGDFEGYGGEAQTEAESLSIIAAQVEAEHHRLSRDGVIEDHISRRTNKKKRSRDRAVERSVGPKGERRIIMVSHDYIPGTPKKKKKKKDHGYAFARKRGGKDPMSEEFEAATGNFFTGKWGSIKSGGESDGGTDGAVTFDDEGVTGTGPEFTSLLMHSDIARIGRYLPEVACRVPASSVSFELRNDQRHVRSTQPILVEAPHVMWGDGRDPLLRQVADDGNPLVDARNLEYLTNTELTLAETTESLICFSSTVWVDHPPEFKKHAKTSKDAFVALKNRLVEREHQVEKASEPLSKATQKAAHGVTKKTTKGVKAIGKALKDPIGTKKDGNKSKDKGDAKTTDKAKEAPAKVARGTKEALAKVARETKEAPAKAVNVVQNPGALFKHDGDSNTGLADDSVADAESTDDRSDNPKKKKSAGKKIFGKAAKTLGITTHLKHKKDKRGSASVGGEGDDQSAGTLESTPSPQHSRGDGASVASEQEDEASAGSRIHSAHDEGGGSGASHDENEADDNFTSAVLYDPKTLAEATSDDDDGTTTTKKKRFFKGAKIGADFFPAPTKEEKEAARKQKKETPIVVEPPELKSPAPYVLVLDDVIQLRVVRFPMVDDVIATFPVSVASILNERSMEDRTCDPLTPSELFVSLVQEPSIEEEKWGVELHVTFRVCEVKPKTALELEEPEVDEKGKKVPFTLKLKKTTAALIAKGKTKQELEEAIHAEEARAEAEQEAVEAAIVSAGIGKGYEHGASNKEILRRQMFYDPQVHSKRKSVRRENLGTRQKGFLEHIAAMNEDFENLGFEEDPDDEHYVRMLQEKYPELRPDSDSDDEDGSHSRIPRLRDVMTLAQKRVNFSDDASSTVEPALAEDAPLPEAERGSRSATEGGTPGDEDQAFLDAKKSLTTSMFLEQQESRLPKQGGKSALWAAVVEGVLERRTLELASSGSTEESDSKLELVGSFASSTDGLRMSALDEESEDEAIATPKVRNKKSDVGLSSVSSTGRFMMSAFEMMAASLTSSYDGAFMSAADGGIDADERLQSMAWWLLGLQSSAQRPLEVIRSMLPEGEAEEVLPTVSQLLIRSQLQSTNQTLLDAHRSSQRALEVIDSMLEESESGEAFLTSSHLLVGYEENKRNEAEELLESRTRLLREAQTSSKRALQVYQSLLEAVPQEEVLPTISQLFVLAEGAKSAKPKNLLATKSQALLECQRSNKKVSELIESMKTVVETEEVLPTASQLIRVSMESRTKKLVATQTGHSRKLNVSDSIDEAVGGSVEKQAASQLMRDSNALRAAESEKLQARAQVLQVAENSNKSVLEVIEATTVIDKADSEAQTSEVEASQSLKAWQKSTMNSSRTGADEGSSNTPRLVGEAGALESEGISVSEPAPDTNNGALEGGAVQVAALKSAEEGTSTGSTTMLVSSAGKSLAAPMRRSTDNSKKVPSTLGTSSKSDGGDATTAVSRLQRGGASRTLVTLSMNSSLNSLDEEPSLVEQSEQCAVATHSDNGEPSISDDVSRAHGKENNGAVGTASHIMSSGTRCRSLPDEKNTKAHLSEHVGEENRQVGRQTNKNSAEISVASEASSFVTMETKEAVHESKEKHTDRGIRIGNVSDDTSLLPLMQPTQSRKQEIDPRAFVMQQRRKKLNRSIESLEQSRRFSIYASAVRSGPAAAAYAQVSEDSAAKRDSPTSEKQEHRSRKLLQEGSTLDDSLWLKAANSILDRSLTGASTHEARMALLRQLDPAETERLTRDYIRMVSAEEDEIKALSLKGAGPKEYFNAAIVHLKRVQRFLAHLVLDEYPGLLLGLVLFVVVYLVMTLVISF